MTCSAFLLLQRPSYSHSITTGPTCTGIVDPVICKTTGQVEHQLPKTPLQRYLLEKEISWERGHQLAMKSVLNSPFLLGNLRMDYDEVLWQDPNLGPSFEVAPPHDLHASIYTSTGNPYSCRSFVLVRVHFNRK